MKAFANLILSAAALGFAAVASAAPVQYQVTGTHAIEFDGSHAPIGLNDYLFANGTSIGLTFSYDASGAANGSSYFYAPYGSFTLYNSAANFVGSVAGHQFGATTGATGTLNDASPVPGYVFDGVVNVAGNVDNAGTSYGSGFQGFTIGGYTLVGFNFYTLSGSNYLSSLALPGQLSNGGETAIVLTFVDGNNVARNAVFTANIAAVPVPAAAWLFASGLLGLATTRRARNK